MTKKPELLLPVGNIEMCQAAIHNGANAIYVGMPEFNARGRTTDHSFEQLEEIIKLCHTYDVKVHVAFNIVIFEQEIPRAMELLRKLLPLSPDAIIVQDLGLVKLIKEMAPWQIIHASTQMTVTNELAIEMTKDLDIERYVLGRENSLSEIKKIKENTDKELEVFVHGALCVAYSGQCFTSESIGGRSANRGQCAQSCRFEYDLIVDDKKVDLIDQKYLVSPQDLCGIDEVDQLREIGVDSLKVEGRLKSPLFVASVANSYRAAIDHQAPTKDLKEEMAITYSRGFFPGWLHGVNHQDLVDGTFGSNRGLKIGQVQEVRKNSVIIASDRNLEKGDGLLFASVSEPKKKETGGMIYDIRTLKNRRFEIYFQKDFKVSAIKEGYNIYQTSSPKITKDLSKSFTDKHSLLRRPIKVNLEAHCGQPLKLTASISEKVITITDELILEPSKNDVNIDSIKKEISALSATPFICESPKVELSEVPPFIPNKTLKKLRQRAISQLLEELTTAPVRDLNEVTLPSSKERLQERDSKIRLLLREISQLEEVLPLISSNQVIKERLDFIILDYEFGRDYQTSLDLLREYGIKSAIATNRILKPGEYHHLKLLLRIKPDVILVRNLGALQFIKEHDPEQEVIGDFSLNIANSVTASYLFKKGLSSLTPSYDLNRDQLLALIEHSENKNFEITVHQYMPSFHMEHCVYAAFLSNGKSFKDCGKPCEKHKVELHDSFGNKHFIKADSECRNTMYNATSISAPTLLKECEAIGVSLFRIEALHEDAKTIYNKLLAFTNLLSNQIEPAELNKELGLHENYGLSSGQIFKEDSYIDRKKF
ncbi:U32 family peptidase [Halobacteriovorax sp. JY17]|uniref:U32 family peptidase n=1 Tax=Halobacteriovorax sp. JY17 TaxID=2014617 RepID=UPI000C56DD74|nr:U32 family peptidase [Halobacteriovorax sp. JY17]PIK16268.1 MAG: collagenase [Halobacteriovorax sp. JY17]